MRALPDVFCPAPATLGGHDALALPALFQLLEAASDLARRRAPGTTRRTAVVAARIARLAGADAATGLCAAMACQLRWCGAPIVVGSQAERASVLADVGASVASLLALPAAVEQALRGWGQDRSGAALYAHLADELVTHAQAQGLAHASHQLAGGAGHAWPRELLGPVLEQAPAWLADPDDALPAAPGFLPASASLAIVADVTERAYPWWSAHARRVAALALGAARELGLADRDQRSVVRAALLHGLGRLALPTLLWTRREPLLDAQMERLRRAPFFTARVAGLAAPLEDDLLLASRAYERLDGSGYGLHLAHEQLDMPQRVLACALMLAAMRAPRPWRRALGQPAAEAVLAAQTASGKLDRQAVAALLAACRQVQPPESPGGLAPRQQDVLRRLGQGMGVVQVARALRLSGAAVREHERAAIGQLGCATRDGAMLRALSAGWL